MYATIFGDICFPGNDFFFSMPPVILSAGDIIKISGYTNAECYQSIALIDAKNEIARLEELAKKLCREKKPEMVDIGKGHQVLCYCIA